LAKQKNRTSKSSSSFANKNNSSSNGPKKPIPLLTNEIKFDKQIDIPNSETSI